MHPSNQFPAHFNVFLINYTFAHLSTKIASLVFILEMKNCHLLNFKFCYNNNWKLQTHRFWPENNLLNHATFGFWVTFIKWCNLICPVNKSIYIYLYVWVTKSSIRLIHSSLWRLCIILYNFSYWSRKVASLVFILEV